MIRHRHLVVILCAIGSIGAIGCATPMPRPDAGSPAALVAARPSATARGPGMPAPGRATYAADEAIRDALSGPLEVVGVGGWPGVFRRLSCIYRNERVFVVDERCSDPREPDSLVVHVLSPTRGRATLFAEAATPIGQAARPDYKAFGVASSPPRQPPASLAVSMSYEDVVAYEADPRGTVRGTCSAGTHRPEGFCSKGVTTTAAEFAASVEPFLRRPPPAWYDLVRALVRLRVQAHAGIRPGSLPLPRLAAWGASWARDQDVTVDETNMKRVGNALGRSASIVLTRDGGVLIAGTTSHGGVTVPAVVRADANGTKRWVKALPERGFVTHEVASVVAAPDGAIVLSPGYPNPGWKPTSRVIRLDDEGKLRWQWLGRGKDRHKIPQIVTAQLTARGTVLLRGYIQLVADGDVHGWTGELDGKGKAIREEVGAVLADHGASFE